MTEAQKQAIIQAYADLVGAYEAQIAVEHLNHDWKAHLQTICELESEFEFIVRIHQRFTRLLFAFIEPVMWITDPPEENEED